MIMDKIMKFIKIVLFTALLLNISGCGIYKPVDARKVSPNVNERAAKNIKDGKGFRILGGDPFMNKKMYEVVNKVVEYKNVEQIVVYTNADRKSVV